MYPALADYFQLHRFILDNFTRMYRTYTAAPQIILKLKERFRSIGL